MAELDTTTEKSYFGSITPEYEGDPGSRERFEDLVAQWGLA
jgi:hypothetical protein